MAIWVNNRKRAEPNRRAWRKDVSSVHHFEYSWQQTLLDAFLSSPADLAGKINIAERAIMTRLKGPEKISPAEHLALDDALRSLKVLIADLKPQGNAQYYGHEDKARFG
jgi:hypothetical protein